MNLLSENCTKGEIDIALNLLNLNLERDLSNDIYHLWCGEKWCGGFKGLVAVIKEVNFRISIKNDDIEAKHKKALELEKALEGAREAVIFNSSQYPIFSVLTSTKNGGYIDFARSVAFDGAPCNTSRYKISRNKKYFNQALTKLTPVLDKTGNIFYIE